MDQVLCPQPTTHICMTCLQKHTTKFEKLQALVGKVTLGQRLEALKTSFDFSGGVDIRVGLAWQHVYVTIKGHFLYVWTGSMVRHSTQKSPNAILNCECSTARG